MIATVLTYLAYIWASLALVLGYISLAATILRYNEPEQQTSWALQTIACVALACGLKYLAGI